MPNRVTYHMSVNLNSPITELKGIGSIVKNKYAQLGISTIYDLLLYFPKRYEDYSQISKAADLTPGEVTLKATINQVKSHFSRRGLHMTEAIAKDETGQIALMWFNQPYRANSISDQPYFISGTYSLNHQHFSIINPSIELVSDFPVNTARIISIYKETKGLTSRQIRLAIQQIFEANIIIPETLPSWLIKKYRLMSRSDAIKSIHFPESLEKLKAAKQRLGFEEVFQLSLASLLNKEANRQETSLSIPFKLEVIEKFRDHLPFELTVDQRKVAWQIFQDLSSVQPMNRLVEGDVGSGKTVVAAMAAVMSMAHNYQVALMAPTELLARQHFQTMINLLKSHNLEQEVVLLVGSLSLSQKKRIKELIANGQCRLIIGTHALITDNVKMKNLALVIIDEQHRFGVHQRQLLQAKAQSKMPHVLSLTATPIPRSLALTLYGELDISILGTKPKGRQLIETKIISSSSIKQLYEHIEREIIAGRQIYYVCPLITDSTNYNDSSSVEKIYQDLIKKEFKHRRVGLLHGKLKAKQKNDVMEQFVQGNIDILVSTTVIEVGVDVSNASTIVIHNAERFGLAQLHQLRGRVGRGQEIGYCFLLMIDSSQPSRRLRALEGSQDGFRLAEMDLEMRGPGAIYGSMQHGQLDLRIAKLSDVHLIHDAKLGAIEFLTRKENLLQYKELSDKVTKFRTITNLN